MGSDTTETRADNLSIYVDRLLLLLLLLRLLLLLLQLRLLLSFLPRLPCQIRLLLLLLLPTAAASAATKNTTAIRSQIRPTSRQLL